MGRFRQPDRRSCGAAVLVMARMLAEPHYARWIRGADDDAGRFADEVLRTHRRTNRLVDARRGLQLPWPRALGTQPWALARELPGRHRAALVRGRAGAWQRLVEADRPVPLYVGNRLLPRHVVLVTGRDAEDRVRVYEPGSGDTVRMHRTDFLAGSLDLAGWNRPWFVVLPR
ncbi:hypothetical protein [Nocardioides sp.]|uniref:hypothetical protein n=1 Tax=Nocardioides sp. TaxID=35761 RepID=UPI002ED63732